tara:strand:+ start:1637 stop:2503 length:867 start_codon:yes stop_codon:yes gene_type:complete
MGGGGSQSIRQSIDIKSTTSILEKNIQTNSQKVQAAATANNSIEASVGINPITGEMGNIIGCNMNFKQTATADAQSSATSSIESIAESKQEIANDMKSKVAAAMEKSTQAGNFQFGDKSNTEIDIKKDIQTTVENVFEKENLQSVVGNAVSVNSAKIQIGNMDCTLGGELNFEQDASAKVAATAVMGDVTKKLMETSSIVKVIEEVEAKQKTENKGAAEVVDSVGDAAAGIIGAAGMAAYAPLIACVLICGSMIMVAMMMSKSKGGRQAMGSGVNKLAAMRAMQGMRR